METETKTMMSDEQYNEIMSRFSYHLPDAEGVKSMEEIRVKCRELGFLIQGKCPQSREKATALTQLSFVMMAANSAIVQQYPIKE